MPNIDSTLFILFYFLQKTHHSMDCAWSGRTQISGRCHRRYWPATCTRRCWCVWGCRAAGNRDTRARSNHEFGCWWRSPQSEAHPVTASADPDVDCQIRWRGCTSGGQRWRPWACWLMERLNANQCKDKRTNIFKISFFNNCCIYCQVWPGRRIDE